MGGTNARDWAIDRQNDSYLRNVAHGGGAEPEIRNRTIWSFLWRGFLLTLRLDLVESGGEKGEEGWSRWSLVWIDDGIGLHREVKPFDQEFVNDLTDALTAHKGFGGAYSKHYSYRAEVEISRGCPL